jgi:Na+/serine symporter
MDERINEMRNELIARLIKRVFVKGVQTLVCAVLCAALLGFGYLAVNALLNGNYLATLGWGIAFSFIFDLGKNFSKSMNKKS